MDVAAAVNEAFALQRGLAEARGLTLANEVPEGLPRAWADRDLLLRVLQNLIGNAIRFSPHGGRVRVGAEPLPGEPGELRVTVADEGPGVAPEVRDRLFEKFATGRHEGRGTGLGLHFCKLAVEAHGGRIHSVNAPGGGALLAFTLPGAHETTGSAG
jgi:signal transduction histidine kinase